MPGKLGADHLLKSVCRVGRLPRDHRGQFLCKQQQIRGAFLSMPPWNSPERPMADTFGQAPAARKSVLPAETPRRSPLLFPDRREGEHGNPADAQFLGAPVVVPAQADCNKGA